MKKLSFTLILSTLTVTLSSCSWFSRKEDPSPSRPATPLEQPKEAHHEHGHDQEVTSSAMKHAEHHWSYEGETGPEHWADLKSDYLECREGHSQSPVDLVFKRPQQNRPLGIHYSKTSAHIVDNGHTIQINFDEGNSVVINGKTYHLLQAHFHSPSEHTISGNRLPMEVHLVHKSGDGKLAVLGAILIEGVSHPVVEQIWQNIPIQKEVEKNLEFQVNPADLIPRTRTYYHYMGSLTTPPCSEGVNWNVFNTPVTVSKEQIISFRQLYPNNSRPVQSLNERKTTNYK